MPPPDLLTGTWHCGASRKEGPALEIQVAEERDHLPPQAPPKVARSRARAALCEVPGFR